LNGVSERDIMRQTGHKSAEMLARYIPHRGDLHPQRRRRARHLAPEKKGFSEISGC
jgi:hypothetical protein